MSGDTVALKLALMRAAFEREEQTASAARDEEVGARDEKMETERKRRRVRKAAAVEDSGVDEMKTPAEMEMKRTGRHVRKAAVIVEQTGGVIEMKTPAGVGRVRLAASPATDEIECEARACEGKVEKGRRGCCPKGAKNVEEQKLLAASGCGEIEARLSPRQTLEADESHQPSSIPKIYITKPAPLPPTTAPKQITLSAPAPETHPNPHRSNPASTTEIAHARALTSAHMRHNVELAVADKPAMSLAAYDVVTGYGKVFERQKTTRKMRFAGVVARGMRRIMI